MTQLAVLHKILRQNTDFSCTERHTQSYAKTCILVVLKGIQFYITQENKENP